MKLFKLTAILTLGFIPTTSSWAAGEKSVSETMQTEAYSLTGKDVMTVKFDKGSSKLTESEKTTLRSVVNAVKRNDKIGKVFVAAWSDSKLPNSKDSKLSDSEQKLAAERAEGIEKTLEELGLTDVDTYNMAENPNVLQNMFKTKEAKIKTAVKTGNAPTEQEDPVASIITSKGGPSSAVVIIAGEKTNKAVH